MTSGRNHGVSSRISAVSSPRDGCGADDAEVHARADADAQEAEQHEADPGLDRDHRGVVRRAGREDEDDDRPAGVVGQPHAALLADAALDPHGEREALRAVLDQLEAEADDERRLQPEVDVEAERQPRRLVGQAADRERVTGRSR